jgi:hypothetical protein
MQKVKAGFTYDLKIIICYRAFLAKTTDCGLQEVTYNFP